MSPRVFQRKSLRGQTKHLIQFFFRLPLLAHIVFVLYEQKQVDNLAYIVRLHGAERLFFKQCACLNEQFRLFLLETKVWLKRLKRFSHLRKTVDTQFCHAVVPSGNVAAPESLSNPRERRIMPTVLVETYRRHEAYSLGRVCALLQLEHETSVSVQEARDVRTFCIGDA